MDWTLFRALNRMSADTAWAHGLMKAYASYGIVIFVSLLAVAAVVAIRQSDALCLSRTVWAAGAALIVLAVNQPIANWVDRARPYAAHSRVLLLVDPTKDPSFMSDHSLVTGAVAVGLFFAVKRIGLVAIAAALFMGFARVYVGAHYPGDVVAGFAFATLVVVAGLRLSDRLLCPLAKRVLEVPLVSKFRRTL